MDSVGALARRFCRQKWPFKSEEDNDIAWATPKKTRFSGIAALPEFPTLPCQPRR